MIAFLANTRNFAVDAIDRLPETITWDVTRGGGIITFPAGAGDDSHMRKEEFKIITMIHDCKNRNFTEVRELHEVSPELLAAANARVRKVM